VALTIARIFHHDVSTRRDGEYYVNHPFEGDGFGEHRINAYKKMGFGNPSPSGFMYGVVRNGKLEPVTPGSVPSEMKIPIDGTLEEVQRWALS